MNLREILAKKLNKEEEKEEITFVKFLDSTKKSPLFLSIIFLYINNLEQTSLSDIRTLSSFLLDEEDTYILNTFSHLDIDNIAKCFPPPPSAMFIHNLYFFLNHIYLNVPSMYQEEIEDFIKEKYKIEK